MQAINKITELSKSLCIYVSKGPTNALYTECEKTFTFAAVFPKVKTKYFERFGLNIAALLAMDFLPIVEGKDVADALMNLEKFLSQIPDDQFENYLANIDTYFIALANAYVYPTDCSNAEFNIRHIDFTLPQYLSAIDLAIKNDPQGFRYFSHELNSGKFSIKVMGENLLNNVVNYDFVSGKWSSFSLVNADSQDVNTYRIYNAVDSFLHQNFTEETLEILSRSFVHEDYI